jgi:long-chain acyl-CoA synthetase
MLATDAEGHLKIIDRAKDVGKLVDGRSSHRPSRTKLKFFPTIKEAVAFGDRREMVCAFINIDMEAVGNWAEGTTCPTPATPISPPSPK